MINKALFSTENISEVVTLENIAQREDYLIMKDNLYCLTTNCNCRLIYIPQGKKVAHLKKWKGNNHIEECIYYVETDRNGRSRKILGTTRSRLRDNHIGAIKKDIYDKLIETEEERNNRLQRRRNIAGKRRNSVVETQGKLALEEKLVNQPTTRISGEFLSKGERNPPVKRRVSILDFIFADIGMTVGTGGILTNLIIEDKYTILTVSDIKKLSSFNLYLEEVFYVNSTLNIQDMLNDLSLIYFSKNKIIVTCVGEVVFREGEFGMLIMKDSDLAFNREPLTTFLMYANTLF